MKLKAKKMIGDFAMRLDQLREYGTCVVKEHPCKRAATAVFGPLVLFYILIKTVLF